MLGAAANEEVHLALRFWILALMTVLVGGCASPVQMSGSADDGETFKGRFEDTEAYATSGPVEFTSNRGAKCMGQFRFEGLIGPAGRMSFICADGRTGEATMNGVWNGSAHGTIGGKSFTMKWGSGA